MIYNYTIEENKTLHSLLSTPFTWRKAEKF